MTSNVQYNTEVDIVSCPEIHIVAHTAIEPEFWEYLEEYGYVWPSGYDKKPDKDTNPLDHTLWIKEHPGEALAEFAGRGCYESFDGAGHGAGRRTNKGYIENIIEMGHGSVLEHASITLILRGGSRGLSHEHVRHRVGTAYSQGSTRYCDGDKFRMVMPQLVTMMIEESSTFVEDLLDKSETMDLKSDEYKLLCRVMDLKELYIRAFRDMRKIYQSALDSTHNLASLIYANKLDENDPRQATKLRKAVRSCARALLPIGTEAPITITQNYRQLRNLFNQRGGEGAEFEIRKYAIKLLKTMQELAPHIFGDYEIYIEPIFNTEACRTPYPGV